MLLLVSVKCCYIYIVFSSSKNSAEAHELSRIGWTVENSLCWQIRERRVSIRTRGKKNFSNEVAESMK